MFELLSELETNSLLPVPFTGEGERCAIFLGNKIGAAIVVRVEGKQMAPTGEFESDNDSITIRLPSREKIENEAMMLRRQWMRAMDIPEDEITEYCNSDLYPVDIDEERENVAAMTDLKSKALTKAELKDLADKSPPPAEWFDE